MSKNTLISGLAKSSQIMSKTEEGHCFRPFRLVVFFRFFLALIKNVGQMR